MDQKPSNKRTTVIALVLICGLFGALSACGITWGLPSRNVDGVLFGKGESWSGQKIYRLAHAADKFDKSRGADVDADPLQKRGEPADAPILLTGSEEDIARIYLRYRLYTYQPDEMITMMALSGMRPGSFDFDPRLYQYGGLFIYPVGALIKLCDLIGVIDVRSDVPFYLDHPEQFGRFYIVARAYAALWGMIGVLIVFAIARRIAGTFARSDSESRAAGLLAALLFTLMPVVICMAHEGKPHLPGAVLMLVAVWFAMRHVESHARRDWLLMCVACGAALGMVLSSGPILALIPLVAWLVNRSREDSHARLARVLVKTLAGVGVAALTYLITNPYVPINAIFHRGILQSNLGNSFGMYEIDRVGQGFLRVLELMTEGATLPVLILGLIAAIAAWRARTAAALPLVVAAGIFFVQFVSIGAGKPGEYGRFGIFPDTALLIGAACLLVRLCRQRRNIRSAIIAVVVLWVGYGGYGYLYNFRTDATTGGSRQQLSRRVTDPVTTHATTALVAWFGSGTDVGLIAEPAPYGCPPLPFDSVAVYLFSDRATAIAAWRREPARWTLVWTTDHPSSEPQRPINPASTDAPVTEPASSHPITYVTPISWANKPIEVHEPVTRIVP